MAIRRIPREAIAQPQGYADISVRSSAVVLPGSDARPPSLAVVPAPLGLAYNNTSAAANVLTGVPASGYPVTVIGIVMARDVSTNNVFTTWGNVSDGHRVQIDVNAGSLRAIQVGSVNAVLSKTVSANSWIVFAYTIRSATDRALAVGGSIAATDTTNVTTSAYDRVGILCGVNNGSPSGAQGMDGAASLFAYLPIGCTNEELASLSANPWQIFRDDLIIPVAAAAGGTTVSPAKGALVFGGKVPTISQTVTTTVAPAKGALVFGGKVPTVARTANQTVAPAVGHLAFTGYVPTIAQNASQSVSPAKGALTFTGYAPAVGQTITVTVAPGAGHLALTGYVPTVTRTANQAVAPGAGHLVFAGYAPTVYQSAAGSVQPATGHLAFTGYAPAIARTDHRTVAPSTGHLNFGGHVPTVTPNGTPGTTLDTIYKILTNRQVLDAATGKFTVYDDDDITVLFQANAWADADGTVPYSGGSLRRIDRLT